MSIISLNIFTEGEVAPTIDISSEKSTTELFLILQLGQFEPIFILFSNFNKVNNYISFIFTAGRQ